MKKLFLLALGISSMSFATSVRSVSLESIDTPLRRIHQEDAKIIRVSADGEVFGGTCGMRVVFGHPHRRPNVHPIQINYADCEWETVKFLSRTEIRKLGQWVKSAERGTIKYPSPNDILCRALPTRNLVVKANNGSVLIRSGNYPCGPQTYNTSAAARHLEQMIRDLRAEYDRLVD